MFSNINDEINNKINNLTNKNSISNEETIEAITNIKINTFNEFSKLGLMTELSEAMDAKELIVPTPVQKAVIPRVCAGENIVMAASTGSGKTLAYMLPIIQNMVLQESQGYMRATKRPRTLVLVPTRELARQVLSEVKSVSHYCKVSSTVVIGGEQSSPQKKALNGMVDVVVASPGRLLQHKEAGNVYFSHVTHVVIDEVDTMLTQGFGSDIRAILRTTLGRPVKVSSSNNNNNDSDDDNSDIPSTIITRGQDKSCQLVMATATLTPAVRKLLDDVNGFNIAYTDPSNKTPYALNNAQSKTKIDDEEEARKRIKMSIVEVDGVHRSLPNLRHDFEETKGRDKLSLLREVLHRSKSGKYNNKCMIFCNTLDSCRAVEYTLSEASVPVISYHGGMNSAAREQNMLNFRENDDIDSNLMVCTDIAARGLDISNVKHVIMFDFPLNPIDYIHRAGRTGRAGAPGHVTSLISKRDMVLSDAIQGAIAKGLPLDSLTSAKRDYSPQGKFNNVLRSNKSGKKSGSSSSSSSSSSNRKGKFPYGKGRISSSSSSGNSNTRGGGSGKFKSSSSSSSTRGGYRGKSNGSSTAYGGGAGAGSGSRSRR